MVGQLGASAKFKDGCIRLRNTALSRSSLCRGQSLLTGLSTFSAGKTLQRTKTSNTAAITQQLQPIVVGMDSVKESFNEASTGSMPAWRKEGATASVHMNEDIMDWAAGSSSSPLSGSGNVSSSAVIDKDAQVNDSERTDGKWRHESSTEESCGIATPFSSKKHDIEQGLFIGPAVGTSLTKKMTVNWQDDTACDADFSTRCCDHFSHCGGLGGSIAMATMRAQLGQMSHFSRLAKCCLAKRLLGDGDVKRIPSEVSGATTVSCGDVAECVLVKKRRKKKVPKRRKNFCSAGLDSEDERSVDEIVRLIEGIGETVKKDKKSKRKYNCKANTVAVSERTFGANETVVSSIEAGAGSGEVKAISFNGVDGHSDVIRKKRRDDQQDWMCVAVVTDVIPSLVIFHNRLLG